MKVLSVHIQLSGINTVMNVLSNHLVTVFGFFFLFIWKIFLFIPKKPFSYFLPFLSVAVEMLVFDFFLNIKVAILSWGGLD